MILYLQIDFNTGKIQKRKEKQGACIEYDTEKINENEYIKETMRKVIFMYENRKPKKIEYTGPRQNRKLYNKENTEEPYEYTPRAVVGIIKKNENTEKQLKVIKMLLNK